MSFVIEADIANVPSTRDAIADGALTPKNKRSTVAVTGEHDVGSERNVV
jgi:hypothetical protein